MLDLVRAEWLKLSRRPLTLILLAVFLALLVLQFGQYVFLIVVGRVALAPAQIDELRRFVAFPGIFGTIFGHINGAGGMFAIILAAGAMGSEYSWGTLRTQLARQPVRWRLLVAKLLTLMALLLVAMLLALIVGLPVGWLCGTLLGDAGTLSLGAWAALPLALVRALLVLLPYVLLTLCATVGGRSLLVGLATGMLYLVFEIALGALALFANLGDTWKLLYNLTIQQNINALVQLNSETFGLNPAGLNTRLENVQPPPPGQATVVVLIYSALLLASTLWLLGRRDVGGAG